MKTNRRTFASFRRMRLFICLTMVALLVLSLAACGERLIKPDETLDTSVHAMMDALLRQDEEAAYDLLAPNCTRDEFHLLFTQLVTAMEGASSYELIPTGVNVNKKFGDNGYTNYRAVYLLKLDNGTQYQLDTQRQSDREGMTTFMLRQPDAPAGDGAGGGHTRG